MYARNNSAPHTVGATLSPGGEEKANRYTWKLNRLLTPLQINHFTISNRNKIAFSDFSTHPKFILFFFAGERIFADSYAAARRTTGHPEGTEVLFRREFQNGTLSCCGRIPRSNPVARIMLDNFQLRTKVLWSLALVTAGLTCATLLVVRHTAQLKVQKEIEEDAHNAILTIQTIQQQQQT